MKAKQFIKTSIAKECAAIKDALTANMEVLNTAVLAAENKNNPDLFWNAFYLIVEELCKLRKDYIKKQFNKAKYERDLNACNNK